MDHSSAHQIYCRRKKKFVIDISKSFHEMAQVDSFNNLYSFLFSFFINFCHVLFLGFITMNPHLISFHFDFIFDVMILILFISLFRLFFLCFIFFFDNCQRYLVSTIMNPMASTILIMISCPTCRLMPISMICQIM